MKPVMGQYGKGADMAYLDTQDKVLKSVPLPLDIPTPSSSRSSNYIDSYCSDEPQRTQ